MAVVHYLFVYLPTLAVLQFRRMPLWQQMTIGVLTLTLAGIGAYAYAQKMAKNRTNRQIGEANKQFEDAAQRLDLDAMKDALNKLEKANPNDPVALKRRASIEAGEAPADDQSMILFWMNRYLGAQKFTEAAREARKRIVTVPDDWRARCVLAQEALIRGKIDEATDHLKDLPSPLANRHFVGPADLNYGFGLYRACKLDDSSLRLYRATKIVPVLRFPDVVNFHPSEQMELLKTYVQSFEDIGKFDDLGNFWVGSARLAQNLLEDPESSTQLLVQLGGLQESQLTILGMLVRRRIFDLEQATPLAEELNERQEAIWKIVRERDPAFAGGYLGAAKAASDRRRYAEALVILDAGLKNCKDKVVLLDARFKLVRNFSSPKQALEQMEELAKQYPGEKSLLYLAEAAMGAARPDRAGEVCREALKLDPDLLWAAFLQIRIHLDQERTGKAFEIIDKYRKFIYSEPMLAEHYVRALAQKKDRKAVGPYLKKLADEVPVAAHALMALRAGLKEGFYDEVAVAANRLSERFNQFDRELLFVKGESYAFAAEPTEPGQGWNQVKVRAAVDALKQVQLDDPTDLYSANLLAWLHLKAGRALENAVGAAVPLRAAHAKGTLPEKMLITLAGIAMMQNRYDDARSLLSQGILHNPTADEYVQLGLAHYYLNNQTEARQALSRAGPLPRNSRVSQELTEALSLIDGKKP